jgi:hypothetical protein
MVTAGQSNNEMDKVIEEFVQGHTATQCALQNMAEGMPALRQVMTQQSQVIQQLQQQLASNTQQNKNSSNSSNNNISNKNSNNWNNNNNFRFVFSRNVCTNHIRSNGGLLLLLPRMGHRPQHQQMQPPSQRPPSWSAYPSQHGRKSKILQTYHVHSLGWPTWTDQIKGHGGNAAAPGECHVCDTVASVDAASHVVEGTAAAHDSPCDTAYNAAVASTAVGDGRHLIHCVAPAVHEQCQWHEGSTHGILLSLMVGRVQRVFYNNNKPVMQSIISAIPSPPTSPKIPSGFFS